MGVSTNGIIAFGIPLEDGVELPWDESHDGDIEEWWRDINGFVDVHQPWQNGDYAPGWAKDDPRFDEYYAHRRQWLKENPIPVEFENFCSGDYAMWAATVPGLSKMCRRGYPEEFEPAGLVASEEQCHGLMRFLDKHRIPFEGQPRWLLMSYWG